jgi:hypothetical protein
MQLTNLEFKKASIKLSKVDLRREMAMTPFFPSLTVELHLAV